MTTGTATGGACADASPDISHGELLCPLGTLAGGASATVSLTMTDSAPVGTFAPTIAATARPAIYVDDPVAASGRRRLMRPRPSNATTPARPAAPPSRATGPGRICRRADACQGGHRAAG